MIGIVLAGLRQLAESGVLLDPTTVPTHEERIPSVTKRVYVHIGLPKTGTTFLQSALWEGREHARRRWLPGPRRPARLVLAGCVRPAGSPTQGSGRAQRLRRLGRGSVRDP